MGDLIRIGGLAMLAACGRIGFDHAGGVTDDVTDGALACTTFGPFGPPAPVPELSSPDDDNAVSLSADQLVVMLERHSPGVFALFQASRLSIDTPFSTPTPVSELNSTGSLTNPSLSPDGLTVYFARTLSKSQIHVAARSDRTSPFSTPVLLSIDGTGMDDIFAPEISDDGQELIFSQFVGGIQNSNFMRAVWNPQTSWFEAAPPTGLAELDLDTSITDYLEAWASVSSDGRTIFFTASACAVGGDPCPGPGASWRIYTAERPAPGSPFGTPRLLTELPVVAGAHDGDPELSADGTTLWFSSNRPGSVGGFDVWKATRACL